MAEVFVFGSNLEGRHGAGSAKAAVRWHGAKYGQGIGPQGNAYAIPTKGWHMEVLPLKTINGYVRDFLGHASFNPDVTFRVVAIGCGLAGYDPGQIGPMFAEAGANVILPLEFESYRKAHLEMKAELLARSRSLAGSSPEEESGPSAHAGNQADTESSRQ
jgi:hypothetical protein